MILRALGGFGAALAITVAVEAAAGWLLGLRTGRNQLIVLLINVITNPLMNLAITLAAALGIHLVKAPWDPALLGLEAVVIAAEAALLARACALPARRAIGISFALNIASWLAGALILW